jgi:hypothetical protein
MQKIASYKLASVSVAVFIALNGSSQTIRKKQDVPCKSFNTGNKWTYVTRAEGKPEVLVEETVVSNDRSKITVLSKSHLKTTGQSSSTSTYNYISDGNAIYLTTFDMVTADYKLKYRNLKPEPVCGSIPQQWTDSLEVESPPNAYFDGKQMSPKSLTSIRYTGNEKVQVPAGSFETSVFEKKKFTPNQDESGGGMTFVSTVYYAKDIGIVKEVNIVISKHRKVQQVSGGAVSEKDIQEALSLLEKGEDISKSKFFSDTTTRVVEYSKDWDIFKHITYRELLSVNFKPN